MTDLRAKILAYADQVENPEHMKNRPNPYPGKVSRFAKLRKKIASDLRAIVKESEERNEESPDSDRADRVQSDERSQDGQP